MSIATEIERLQTAKKDIKSAIEEKGVTVGDGNIDTYAEKIGEISAGGDITQNPLYYMNVYDNQWRFAAFPEGFEFVFHVKSLPSNINSLLMNTTGIKTAKLICDKSGSFVFSGVVRGSTVEVLDITEFKPTPTNLNYFAISNSKLVSVLGELDMTNCTTATNAFNGTTALQEIRFKEGTISIALSFAYNSLLTAESVQSIIDGLADLTGGTAQKIEFYSTISDSLTDEQLAQIWAKNWTTE